MAEITKPTVQLSGENGNIFHLMGIATRALESAGQRDKAKEMQKKVFSSKSHEEAIWIIMEYCIVK